MIQGQGDGLVDKLFKVQYENQVIPKLQYKKNDEHGSIAGSKELKIPCAFLPGYS